MKGVENGKYRQSPVIVICVYVFGPWHINVNYYVRLRLSYFRIQNRGANVSRLSFLTGQYIYLNILGKQLTCCI